VRKDGAKHGTTTAEEGSEGKDNMCSPSALTAASAAGSAAPEKERWRTRVAYARKRAAAAVAAGVGAGAYSKCQLIGLPLWAQSET
jgi:hypothetical protein